MPGSHLQLAGHLQLVLLHICGIRLVDSNDLFTFVSFIFAYILSTLVLELHIKLAVGLILHVNYVDVAIVSASQ